MDPRKIAGAAVAALLVAFACSLAAAAVHGTRATAVISRNANGPSRGGSFSQDGRKVDYYAFASMASNLVGGDTNGRQDVFVLHRGSSPSALGGSLDLPKISLFNRWRAIAEINGGWPRGNDFTTDRTRKTAGHGISLTGGGGVLAARYKALSRSIIALMTSLGTPTSFKLMILSASRLKALGELETKFLMISTSTPDWASLTT